jgi:hypothetical protein
VKLSVQVTTVVSDTSVIWSTPGPVRWKLWLAELSWTSTSYVPGSRFVTGCPLKVSEIVKFGPTVPISFGLTVGRCGTEPAPAGTTATRAARAANPASALPTPVPTSGAVERIV